MILSLLILLRVWVPLSVPVLYPRLNVDVNKCKHEPGSKIAQNSNLKTTQSVFFPCQCPCYYNLQCHPCIYIFSIPFVIFLLKFHI